ncbi:hypothetical protein ABZ807_30365 [Micromonospora sp. NPDC047548]|uniref:hypothetical protein n=1 Tax=Micromonospora sp. NPDC047548 TaxID=3155624 RepID=UPI0033CEAF68
MQALVPAETGPLSELLAGDVGGSLRPARPSVQVGGQFSQPPVGIAGERCRATLQPAQRVLDPPCLSQGVGDPPELVRRGQVMGDHLDQRVHPTAGGQHLLQIGRPEPVALPPLVVSWLQPAQRRPPFVDHVFESG